MLLALYLLHLTLVSLSLLTDDLAWMNIDAKIAKKAREGWEENKAERDGEKGREVKKTML